MTLSPTSKTENHTREQTLSVYLPHANRIQMMGINFPIHIYSFWGGGVVRSVLRKAGGNALSKKRTSSLFVSQAKACFNQRSKKKSTILNHENLGGTPLKEKIKRSVHLLVSRHQAADESRDQTAAHSADILGNQPNGGTHLTRDTDGQLSVGVRLVLGAARSNEIVVDV